MSSPSISIISTGRNSERWIDASISSVLRQTVTDWELLWLDDGGTDKGYGRVCEWAMVEPRIRPFRQVTRRGQCFNTVWLNSLARAEVCVELDADDSFLSNTALERILSQYEQGADATFGMPEPWPGKRLEDPPQGERRIDAPFVYPAPRSWRRELLLNFPSELYTDPIDGGPLILTGDFAFFGAIVTRAGIIKHIPESLYRINTENPDRDMKVSGVQAQQMRADWILEFWRSYGK